MIRFFIYIIIFFISLLHTSAQDVDKDTVPFSALLLSRYIEYESVTGNEKPAGEFFARISDSLGFNVHIFTDEYDSYNFASSLYPLSSGKPNVIFLNHIDVVAAENGELNMYPPFSGTIADGNVWGRGAIDMKGQAVMQLLGMHKFVDKAKEKDFPYNITMLSVSGEETGGQTGAMIIADKYLDILNPVVIFGEGGVGLPGILDNNPERQVFGISVASKRGLWLELTLDMDISGHGAVPPINYTLKEKVAALDRVIKRNQKRIVRLTEPSLNMFHEVGELEGGLRGFMLKNIRIFRPFIVPQLKKDEIIYSLVSNTITLTGFSTQPGPPNNIPQLSNAVLDCRLLPEMPTDEFLEKVRKWLNNDDIKINIIHEGVIAKPTSPGIFFEFLKQAIISEYPEAGVISILAPASNDNNFFRAKGIPAYGIIPVFLSLEHLRSIHNINERISMDLLEQGVRVHEELIRLIVNYEQE
jgi:carboxypeptidase PM20D1